MSIVIVEQGQCLIDIATQHCGTAEQLVEIALLNGIDIDDVDAGFEVQLPPSAEAAIVVYLADKTITPASAITPQQAAAVTDEWTLYYTTGLPANHG